jgi:hypothetical protein
MIVRKRSRQGRPHHRWRQLSRCLIQRRGRAWLTQIIKILAIEGAERGFDRGAEAGYAVPNTFSEQRRPDSGLEKNFWRAHGGRTARMKFAVQFSAMLGSNLVEKFRAHLSVTTSEGSLPDLETQAERRIGKNPSRP